MLLKLCLCTSVIGTLPADLRSKPTEEAVFLTFRPRVSSEPLTAKDCSCHSNLLCAAIEKGSSARKVQK